MQAAVGVFSQYFAGLNRSLAAVYELLEQRRVARGAVIGLLSVHSALLAYSAYVHSPTLNEPAHLVAGLSHWKFGRFELYRNNPPLVRMVAALPVMAIGYEEDWSGYHEGPGAQPQYAMGGDFVAANGERSFFLFLIARWACLPFSWLGAIICYLWARDLFGRPSGVAACAIWCFEPNILAHASLMTPDAHAAALGLAACYAFWRWLKQPTWSQAALTGVVLGLAELAKTTLLLFYLLWPLMWLAYRWPERCGMATRDWLREAGMLVLRMAIGLYVLNLGYAFEGSLKPLGEFHFISDLLTETHARDQSPDVTGAADHANPSTYRRQPPISRHNRFADTWLGGLPVPVPANYLLGIDIQKRYFEHWSRPSYLRGEWRDCGWWYYYLYAAAIKVPLGLWLLAALNLFSAILIRPTSYNLEPQASFRDHIAVLFPPIAVFAVVSSQSGFNEHFRYVLPSFPFAFIWLAGFFSRFRPTSEQIFDSGNLKGVKSTDSIEPSAIFATRLLAYILLIWAGISSTWIYPHSISYFNESIGGPLHGSKHLLGSNVDWGQDLKYVLTALQRSARLLGSTSCVLTYIGGFDPRELGYAGHIRTRSHLASVDDVAWKECPCERDAASQSWSKSLVLHVESVNRVLAADVQRDVALQVLGLNKTATRVCYSSLCTSSLSDME